MHANDEEKPMVATVLSLSSGTLFLYLALILRVSQPWSLMMVSSVLTVFVALFMFAYPRCKAFCGILVIIFSLVSFLAIEMSAPWGHIIIWHRDGEIIFYQPDLSLHIFSGIPLLMLGVGGGTIALLHKYFTFRIEATPKVFLKKCIECGREIPIASEGCQYCGAKQKTT